MGWSCVGNLSQFKKSDASRCQFSSPHQVCAAWLLRQTLKECSKWCCTNIENFNPIRFAVLRNWVP